MFQENLSLFSLFYSTAAEAYITLSKGGWWSKVSHQIWTNRGGGVRGGLYTLSRPSPSHIYATELLTIVSDL